MLNLCWDWITYLEKAFICDFFFLSKFSQDGWGFCLGAPTALALFWLTPPWYVGLESWAMDWWQQPQPCPVDSVQFPSLLAADLIRFAAPSSTTPQGSMVWHQVGYFMIIQLLFCKSTWSVSSKTKDAAPDGCVQEVLTRERWEWQNLFFQTIHPTAKNLLDWCVFHWAT